MLNRRFKWTRRRITRGANPRHVVAIVKGLRLEGAKGCSTPADAKGRNGGTGMMTPDKAKRHRSLAARVSYVSLDRTDTQAVTREAVQQVVQTETRDTDFVRRLELYFLVSPWSGCGHF